MEGATDLGTGGGGRYRSSSVPKPGRVTDNKRHTAHSSGMRWKRNKSRFETSRYICTYFGKRSMFLLQAHKKQLSRN